MLRKWQWIQFNSKKINKSDSGSKNEPMCIVLSMDPSISPIYEKWEWANAFNICFAWKHKIKIKKVKKRWTISHRYIVVWKRFVIYEFIEICCTSEYIHAGSTFWHNILVVSALHNEKMLGETKKMKKKKKKDFNRMEIQYFRQNVLSFILTNVLWIYE